MLEWKHLWQAPKPLPKAVGLFGSFKLPEGFRVEVFKTVEEAAAAGFNYWIDTSARPIARHEVL